MPERKHTDLHHDTDLIVEWLLYRVAEDRVFTNASEIQQGTGLEPKEVYNAVRALVAVWGVLAYDRPGVYRILDLEPYFAPRPEAGAAKRWRRRYTR